MIFFAILVFSDLELKTWFEVFVSVVVSRLRESPGSSRIWSHPLGRKSGNGRVAKEVKGMKGRFRLNRFFWPLYSLFP